MKVKTMPGQSATPSARWHAGTLACWHASIKRYSYAAKRRPTDFGPVTLLTSSSSSVANHVSLQYLDLQEVTKDPDGYADSPYYAP